MGQLTELSRLAGESVGRGVVRRMLGDRAARYMSVQVLEFSAGAELTGVVPAGSDLYCYALQGSARLRAGETTAMLNQDTFATVQEGYAYELANPSSATATLISVLAPPPGGAAAHDGFAGGLSVITRAAAAATDIPEQRKRRLYFVAPGAAKSARAHAMIVEYQPDTVTVMHQHPNADSLFVPLTGKVRFTYDGKDHVLARGQAALFPAGDLHGLRVEEGQVSFLEFHVPAAYTTVK